MPHPPQAELQTEPGEVRIVRDEPATLRMHSDDVWFGRYALRGGLTVFRGLAAPPAPGVIDPDSVAVRTVDGRELVDGADYLLDRTWGVLCLPEGHDGTLDVLVDYRYGLRRLDAIAHDTRGAERVIRGHSALTNPHQPRPGVGETIVAHLLTEPFATEAVRYDVRAAQQVPTIGALPAVTSAIAAGGPVRLLFLGDSISEGGDASTDEATYTAVAQRALADLPVDVRVAAVGGSHSAQWLDDTDDARDWRLVETAAPDVTVIEFLNDAYQPPETWAATWTALVNRLRALGSEVVLTTPIFTHPASMDAAPDAAGLAQDGRSYTAFIREFAREHDLPLIDVSARWAALQDEGLPYWTFLSNGINHPDDRGHRFMGEFVADGLRALLTGRGA